MRVPANPEIAYPSTYKDSLTVACTLSQYRNQQEVKKSTILLLILSPSLNTNMKKIPEDSPGGGDDPLSVLKATLT